MHYSMRGVKFTWDFSFPSHKSTRFLWSCNLISTTRAAVFRVFWLPIRSCRISVSLSCFRAARYISLYRSIVINRSTDAYPPDQLANATLIRSTVIYSPVRLMPRSIRISGSVNPWWSFDVSRNGWKCLGDTVHDAVSGVSESPTYARTVCTSTPLSCRGIRSAIHYGNASADMLVANRFLGYV